MNKYARDIVFAQGRKLAKNAYSRMEIKDAAGHEKATQMRCAPVKISDNVWHVTSESSEVIYEVKKEMEQCNCRIQCRKCRICPHLFVCGCVDNLLNANMCKHIHLVAMSLHLNGSPNPGNNDLVLLEGELQVEVGEPTSTPTQDAINEVKHILRLLQDPNLNADGETIEAGLVDLRKFREALAMNIGGTSRVPANKIPDRQLRFVANKKRGRKRARESKREEGKLRIAS